MQTVIPTYVRFSSMKYGKWLLPSVMDLEHILYW